MGDVAGVREHDQQHAGKADYESRRPQSRDRLVKREPRDQSDEEWRGVQQHRRDGRAGAVRADADADLCEGGVAEADRGRPEPASTRPR